MAVQFGKLVFKIVELGIAIALIALIEHKNIVLPRTMLTCGTFAGYSIICAALVISHLISSPLDKRIDMLLSIGGAVLFVASGSVIIDAYKDQQTFLNIGKEYKDYALAAGGISIVNAIVFIVDVIITFRS